MTVLKMKVDGTWIPVGGPPETVWTGPSAPTDSTIDLWIDTDEPALSMGTVASAHVSAAGTFIAQTGCASVTRVANGQYRITYTQAVTGAVVTATVIGVVGIAVVVLPTTTTVEVHLLNLGSAPINADFMMQMRGA